MRVFGSAFDEYNWVTVLMIAALTASDSLGDGTGVA